MSNLFIGRVGVWLVYNLRWCCREKCQGTLGRRVPDTPPTLRTYIALGDEARSFKTAERVSRGRIQNLYSNL